MGDGWEGSGDEKRGRDRGHGDGKGSGERARVGRGECVDAAWASARPVATWVALSNVWPQLMDIQLAVEVVAPGSR